MSKIVKYKTDTKTYTITSCPLLLTDTGRWTLNISISWTHDGSVTTRPFSAENTYQTEEEADIHSINYGQRIIDGKVPGLSVN